MAEAVVSTAFAATQGSYLDQGSYLAEIDSFGPLRDVMIAQPIHFKDY